MLVYIAYRRTHDTFEIVGVRETQQAIEDLIEQQKVFSAHPETWDWGWRMHDTKVTRYFSSELFFTFNSHLTSSRVPENTGVRQCHATRPIP